MINPKQFYDNVVVPSFEDMYLFHPILDSDTARKLVFATFLHESKGGTYIKQVHGPALGVYQIEPATFDFVWKSAAKMLIPNWPGPIARDVLLRKLVTDLDFQTKICRLRYFHAPMALPANASLEFLANYWGKYYQTDSQDMNALNEKEKAFIHDAKSSMPGFFD